MLIDDYETIAADLKKLKAESKSDELYKQWLNHAIESLDAGTPYYGWPKTCSDDLVACNYD